MLDRAGSEAAEPAVGVVEHDRTRHASEQQHVQRRRRQQEAERAQTRRDARGERLARRAQQHDRPLAMMQMVGGRVMNAGVHACIDPKIRGTALRA